MIELKCIIKYSSIFICYVIVCFFIMWGTKSLWNYVNLFKTYSAFEETLLFFLGSAACVLTLVSAVSFVGIFSISIILIESCNEEIDDNYLNQIK